MSLNRREFLESAVLALASTGFVATLPSIACGDASERAAGPADDLIPDLEAAIDIGRRYLEAFPDRKPLRAFASEWLANAPEPRDARTRAIAERIRDDFLSGEVVRVTGWRLARTEAMLCAIIAVGGDVS